MALNTENMICGCKLNVENCDLRTEHSNKAAKVYKVNK